MASSDRNLTEKLELLLAAIFWSSVAGGTVAGLVPRIFIKSFASYFEYGDRCLRGVESFGLLGELMSGGFFGFCLGICLVLGAWVVSRADPEFIIRHWKAVIGASFLAAFFLTGVGLTWVSFVVTGIA